MLERLLDVYIMTKFKFRMLFRSLVKWVVFRSVVFRHILYTILIGLGMPPVVASLTVGNKIVNFTKGLTILLFIERNSEEDIEADDDEEDNEDNDEEDEADEEDSEEDKEDEAKPDKENSEPTPLESFEEVESDKATLEPLAEVDEEDEADEADEVNKSQNMLEPCEEDKAEPPEANIAPPVLEPYNEPDEADEEDNEAEAPPKPQSPHHRKKEVMLLDSAYLPDDCILRVMSLSSTTKVEMIGGEVVIPQSFFGKVLIIV
jgi:hypothetical protein